LNITLTKPVTALISCCSQKISRPSEAINLYISPLFLKSKQYAEKYGLPIWILSAKYKLISSKMIIAPYNLTLNDFNTQQLDEWSEDVAAQIKQQFESSPLLVLAGSKYLGFAQYIDNQIIDPMKGLPIGKRLHWLNQRLGAKTK
jgi:hypothetical protein